MNLSNALSLFRAHYPVPQHLERDHKCVAQPKLPNTLDLVLSDSDEHKKLYQEGDLGGMVHGIRGVVLDRHGAVTDVWAEPISKTRLTLRANSVMTVLNAKFGEQVYNHTEVARLMVESFFQWDVEGTDWRTRDMIPKAVFKLMLACERGAPTHWGQDEILEMAHKVHLDMVATSVREYPVSVLMVGFNRKDTVIAPAITR